MRISVFPKGELDALVRGKLSLSDWLAQAAELPIEGVELYSRFFADRSGDFVRQVGDDLARLDLVMPMMCASPDLAHPDASVRARELDEEIRIMQITRALGGRGASTRVLSGQRHPSVARELGLDWVTEAIQTLIPIARELEITLAIENHYKDGFWEYPEFVQRPADFLELLSRIDERVWFGVQFDPSNAITAGADSAEFLTRVVDRVVTMQASDRRLAPGASLDDLRLADGTLGYSPSLQHGVIGEGLNDYEAIFSTLVSAGYDGWISIEDGVNGWGDLRASADFLVDARQRWFGGSTAVHIKSQEQARADAAS